MAKSESGTKGKPTKLSEIIGLILLVAGALVGLALLSYSVRDPSFNAVSVPGAEPSNFAGRAGSYAADVLFNFTGYSSILIPIILALVGYLFFTGRQVKMKLVQFFGYLIFLISLAAILSMIVMSQGVSKAGGGGQIGDVLADLMVFMLGRVGGLLVAFAMLIISLIITVDFSFVGLSKTVGRLSASSVKAVTAWWMVRREQRKRRQRRDEREGGIEVKRKAPIIRRLDPQAKETRQPTAREAKPPKKRDHAAPVRSTRIELANQAEGDVAGATPPPAKPQEQPAKTKPAPTKPPTKKKPVKADIDEKPVKSEKKAAKKKESGEEITIHKKGETEAARQISFSKLAGQYERPPIDLLKAPERTDKQLDREALLAQSVALESKLETFGVTGKVVEIHPGPVITMFEYEPDPGIKVSRIANLEDDLAMALQAEKIRIIAPIPGKGAVGIEVPSLRREIVYLREILESKEFNEAKHPITVAFGKDSTGRPFVQDLSKMPHLLIAGTTGSGKSVFLNCMIASLLYKSTPEQVRLLMVDPKQLELNMYTDTPHMLHPVIVEPKKAALMLRWAVSEMEERYRKLAELGVRNIESYNKKVAKLATKVPKRGTITGEEAPVGPEKLPYIVLFIDELADLMIIAAKEVEESIARLAQMARAAGIHLILATQRPSVDVITGVIKANFPSRISFQVRSRTDSRTILDENGANNLLGMGDGLFLPPGTAKLTRFHAAFIADEEVHLMVDYLKEKHPKPEYVEIRTLSGDDMQNANGFDFSLADENGDEGLFDKAVDIVARDRKASVSYIQRRLKIGYNRAARIIERMEQEGMISPSDGTSRPREIYLPEQDYD